MSQELRDILENVDLDLIQLGSIVEAAAAGFTLKTTADPAAVLEHIGTHINRLDMILQDAISFCRVSSNIDTD